LPLHSMTVGSRKVIPVGSKATFTNRITDANPHRNTTDTRPMGRSSGTSTIVPPRKQSKEGPSITPTASIPLDICARLEGTNPNHAIGGKTFGNASVHEIGIVSIVPGTSEAATTDIASRKTASALISAVGTGFGSTTSRS